MSASAKPIVTPVPPSISLLMSPTALPRIKKHGIETVVMTPGSIKLMTPQELAYKKALEAVEKQDIDKLEKMQREGELALIINEVDEDGNTLLMNAVDIKAIEVIRVLLRESEIDIWCRNNAGLRAIDMICSDYLEGTCPAMKEFYDQLYPDCVCQAAFSGDEKYIEDNLASLDLTAVNLAGDNLLHAAAKAGQANVINLICTKATKEQLKNLLAQKNKAGETPLDTLFAYFFNGNYFINDEAKCKQFIDAAILLINAGASLNSYTYKSIRELESGKSIALSNSPQSHLNDLIFGQVTCEIFKLEHLETLHGYLEKNENARKKIDIAARIIAGVAKTRINSLIRADLAKMKKASDAVVATFKDVAEAGTAATATTDCTAGAGQG